MWAEDGNGWLVALGTLGGTLLTAMTAAIIHLWRARRVIRKEERQDALEEWRELCGRYEKECRETINRYEAQAERDAATIRQMREAVEAAIRALGQCREESARQESIIQFLYGHLKHLHAVAHRAGLDPGELPELPPFRQPRQEGPDAEFVARQAQQSAELAKEARQVLPKPPETP